MLLQIGRLPRIDLSEFFVRIVANCPSTIFLHRESPHLRPDGQDCFFTWEFLISDARQAYLFEQYRTKLGWV